MDGGQSCGVTDDSLLGRAVLERKVTGKSLVLKFIEKRNLYAQQAPEQLATAVSPKSTTMDYRGFK